MVLLGYEAQVEACFARFGDSANLDTRKVHGLRRMYHGLENRYGRTRWNSSVTWVLRNLVSVNLGTVFVSVQDRCRVCAKRVVCSEIVLDTPNGTPRL
jgi:hypothetical protein